MEDPKERLTKCISTAELERRWKAVREMMHDRKIDYLVIQNSEEYMGGTIRWFTDFSARWQFPMSVIFPVDDEMTTINCGGDPPADQFPPAWATRGIKNRWGACYFDTIPYTNTLSAELAVKVLKEKKNPTIGLVERAFIPISFYEHLVQHLPGATFVDASEWVDEIKVPKSPEEIELIKGTAAIQDRAIEYLKKTIKPGKRDFEVYADCHDFMTRNGAERALVQVGSAPAGSPAAFFVRHFQNRMIKEGDQVSVLDRDKRTGRLLYGDNEMLHGGEKTTSRGAGRARGGPAMPENERRTIKAGRGPERALGYDQCFSHEEWIRPQSADLRARPGLEPCGETPDPVQRNMEDQGRHEHHAPPEDDQQDSLGDRV